MILNEREYRIAKARMIVEGANDAAEDIALYEQLRDGACPTITGTLSTLGIVLTQARIARKLTQAQLAEKLGLHEQMIQRYEQSQYAHASLTRLIEIAQALNVTIEVQTDLKLG